jgi:hypothetical protein
VDEPDERTQREHDHGHVEDSLAGDGHEEKSGWGKGDIGRGDALDKQARPDNAKKEEG